MICNTTITVLNVRVSSIFQVKEPFLENKLVQIAKLPDCGPDPKLDELYVVEHGDQEVRQSLIYFQTFQVLSLTLSTLNYFMRLDSG